MSEGAAQRARFALDWESMAARGRSPPLPRLVFFTAPHTSFKIPPLPIILTVRAAHSTLAMAGTSSSSYCLSTRLADRLNFFLLFPLVNRTRLFTHSRLAQREVDPNVREAHHLSNYPVYPICCALP